MTKSELKKLWEKEQRRVKRLIAKAKKQGTEFEFDPTPKPPKRITEQSINRLKKIDLPKIKTYGKPIEEPEKLHTKKLEIEQRKPRVKGIEETYVKKGRHGHPPELTPEQRSERARKAAQTRKLREQNDPEYAERQRTVRLKNLEKAREAKASLTPEQRSERARKAQASLTPKQRSERARKAAQTRKLREQTDPEYAERQRTARLKNLEKAREAKLKKKQAQQTAPEQTKQDKEPTKTTTPKEIKPKQKQGDIVGIDPLTGEALTQTDIETRENKKQEQEKEQQEYKEEPNTKEQQKKREKTTPYKELLKQRQEERKQLREYLEEGDNIIDTLKVELEHAVNEEVADLVSNAIDDMQDAFDTDQERLEWLQHIAENSSELLDRVYNLVDESDGEKVRNSVLATLIIIYNGYSNIPPQTLEDVEYLTNEFHFTRGSKYQRKLIRAKKLRNRYQ